MNTERAKQLLSPPGETWYIWKVYSKVEDSDDPPRLLTPWADPMQYEFAFDFISKTPEDADQLLDDYDAREEAEEEGWVLCKITLEPVRTVGK